MKRTITSFLISMLLVSSATYAAKQSDNSNEPIEITADSLEVFRAENRAIFTGDVEAVQAEMKLNSDVMVVFYKQNDSQSSGDASGMNNAIERIEAEGNVFLSTPEETAQGKFGNYDLDKKTVKLNDQVVLTKGKNVVKGDFFVYNLETGHSKIWSEGASAVSSSTKEGKEKQRVRSVFVPKNNEKDEE